MPKVCKKCGLVCFSDQKECHGDGCNSKQFEPYFEDFSQMRKNAIQQKKDNSSDREVTRKKRVTVNDAIRRSLTGSSLSGKKG